MPPPRKLKKKKKKTLESWPALPESPWDTEWFLPNPNSTIFTSNLREAAGAPSVMAVNGPGRADRALKANPLPPGSGAGSFPADEVLID